MHPWREKTHEIIFEADSPEGKLFDVVLLWSIVLSVIAVLLESIPEVRSDYGPTLTKVEWFFTILFTIEYVLRIISVRKPKRYIFSFFGIIDLLAVIPTYLSLLLPGSQYLLVIRAVRLLRVFRVLKLMRFLDESRVLMAALRGSQHKIVVFLGSVVVLTIIIGSVMYLVEGAESGFTSIPKSIYWAIVTLTTVGYGDIAPQTPLGQALAAMVMILGYCIIAVPTGIVSVELAKAQGPVSTRACPDCGRGGHDYNAKFCKHCGGKL